MQSSPECIKILIRIYSDIRSYQNSNTNIFRYAFVSKMFIRIYSDIRSCHFLDTNIFGYSFVSKSIGMSHSVPQAPKVAHKPWLESLHKWTCESKITITRINQHASWILFLDRKFLYKNFYNTCFITDGNFRFSLCYAGENICKDTRQHDLSMLLAPLGTIR